MPVQSWDMAMIYILAMDAMGTSAAGFTTVSASALADLRPEISITNQFERVVR